jgi:hypothetical protein
MIAPNLNSLCNEAEPYYYDFLSQENQKLIPEPVINHIKQCQHCQSQVCELKSVLCQYENVGPEKSQANAASTTMLKLHFAYIGKNVTCETVRPFLTTLLDPALEIRIPTPITVHMDHCQQCAHDLETIRSLNLTRKQLCRLSRLFVAKPAEDGVSCLEAHSAIMAFVSLAFSETTEEVLNHLCTCYYCHKVLYQYRETVLTDYLREKGGQKNPLCNQIPVADIFDYVVPYGLDPAHDPYCKFRTSLTSHLRSCPVCLARMQQLHDTVYGIVERAESEIVTVYHVNESARVASQSDELYGGFPITVDVLNPQCETKAAAPIPMTGLVNVPKEEIPKPKRKSLVKAGFVAAAAVIIVAALLVPNLSTAKAVTIDQIYKAIEKIQNVYITSFAPDKKEPIQELWVSRTLNICMTKSEQQSVFWDIANKVRKTKQMGTDSIETTLLSDNLISGVEKRISGSLGLMPFYDISDVPPEAEWNQVTDNDLQATTQGIEVYDLIWTEKAYDGSTIFKKWRFFTSPETSLPHRIEVYQKLATLDKYTLHSIVVVKYLNEGEIKSVIQDSFF